MGILNLLTNNFLAKPRTLDPAANIQFPQDFRGKLEHVPSLCTACETCAYVCSPGAISFRVQEEYTEWVYDALQCTFCGRCVEFCPTEALEFIRANEKITTNASTSRQTHRIEHQKCSRCGKFIIPLPEKSLKYHQETEPEDELLKINQLCERCKNKLASEKIKNSLTGNQ